MGRTGSHTYHEKTKLAQLRSSRDVSLDKAAEWIGMTRSTLWRLEQGQIDNPRLPWLVNAALFYGVSLSEVIEDEWLEWQNPPSQFTDDDFSKYWGRLATDKPKPLKRARATKVRITR